MKKRKARRNNQGKVIAEFTAVLVFGLPLLVLLTYLGLECSRFYTIKSEMEVGARSAARNLVVQYNRTGQKNTTVNMTSHLIANSNQFAVDWDPNTIPSFVTVTCSYPSNGAYGLPVFPAGPLKYLTKAATFRLQTVAVQGTFTLPIQ